MKVCYLLEDYSVKGKPIVNAVLQLSHRTGLFDVSNDIPYRLLGSTLISEGVTPFGVRREVIEFHDTCQLLTGYLRWAGPRLRLELPS